MGSNAQRRVLLVDDEPAVRGLAKLVLQQAGWTVTEAASVEQAGNLLRAEPGAFDIAVVDLQLPDGVGPDLEHQFGSAPGAPVFIYSTGDPGALRRITGREGWLLPKPFTPRQLTNLAQQASATRTS
jgi:DNA-binding response OmpR family regulator